MASYLNPEYEESYSLWLMPKGGTAQLLQKEIDTLARGHPGAPVFEPHVTLLPDVRLPGEQVVAKARELAALVKVRANSNSIWGALPKLIPRSCTALLHQFCQRGTRIHLLPMRLPALRQGVCRYGSLVSNFAYGYAYETGWHVFLLAMQHTCVRRDVACLTFLRLTAMFLTLSQDQATMSAGSEARRIYGMEPSPYMPHLSLLYSEIPVENRDEVSSRSDSWQGPGGE